MILIVFTLLRRTFRVSTPLTYSRYLLPTSLSSYIEVGLCF